MTIEERLKELNLELPEVQPAGKYRAAVKVGNLLFLSGQLPKAGGRLVYQGRCGKDFHLEQSRHAARACVLNCVAAAREELGGLDRIRQVVRVTGYINAQPGFTDLAKVMDAASELLLEIFGEAVGSHARVTVGVVELPLGAAMEMEMILAIR